MGAEALLGQGDMLYMASGSGLPVRVHGAFVSDEEVHRVVEYLRSQGEPNYIEGLLEGGVLDGDAEAGAPGEGGAAGESDPMYDQAVGIVLRAPPRVDLAGAAPPAHRLQPRRAAARADGEVRAGVGDGHQRQPRHHRPQAGRMRRLVCCACLLACAAFAARADALDTLREFVRDVKSGRASFTQTVTSADGAKKTQLQRQLRVRAARTAFASPMPSPSSS